MADREILGVVFDKDGTLLDFHGTWDEPFGAMLADFAAGDPAVFAALCLQMGFDAQRRTILDDSPFVYDSNEAFAARLGAVIGRSLDRSDLLQEIEVSLDRLMPSLPVAADGVDEMLAALAQRSIPMAVATNDSHVRARIQMQSLGWDQHFVAILGYNSGHPEKPHPGMVMAAASAMGLAGHQVAMVGDSSTDLGAGRRAGSLVVLVGGRADLAADADVVLTDIGDVVGLI